MCEEHGCKGLRIFLANIELILARRFEVLLSAKSWIVVSNVLYPLMLSAFRKPFRGAS